MCSNDGQPAAEPNLDGAALQEVARDRAKRRAAVALQTLLVVKNYELAFMKLVLRITEGKDDPEMIWRDVQTITRKFNDEMIFRHNSIERMLVWWANKYQDMTQPEHDAQKRRWSSRKLQRDRRERLAKGE